jgi:hypothetical protein
MNRTIATTLLAERVIDDGVMLLRRALPATRHTALGPYVFIDHYRHRSRRGIGDRPHPHAGIEVLSCLLEGSVEHRDSMGFTDRLSADDAQFSGPFVMDTPERVAQTIRDFASGTMGTLDGVPF